MHTGSPIENRNLGHAGLPERTGADAIPRKGPADRRTLSGFSPPVLIVLLILLVWLNEIYDLPSLFFGAPPTPFNWQESLLETFVVVLVAVAFHGFASRLKRERSRERQQAERALRVSDYQYRSFVRNLNGVTYHLDIDLRPVFVHGDLARLTGYQDTDFLNGSVRWDNIVFADDIPEFLEHMNKARTLPGYSVEHSYRLVRKDGTLRWVREYASTICDASGTPVAFQGIVHDITAAREAEEALRRSDALYRLLAENTKDVIWALDTDLRYTYISPFVERSRGYSVEEAMNLPLEKILTKGSYRELQKVLSEMRSPGEGVTGTSADGSRTVELEMVRKDGTIFWAEITAGMVFDSQGRPAGYVGVTRDVSERKAVEEALRRSEETYRAIFESTGTAMVIMGSDTLIALANSEFERLSGHSKEELEGKRSLSDFIAPEDIDRLLEHHNDTGAAGGASPRTYGFRFRDLHGALKDMYVTAAPVPGTGKILLSLLNITEAKKAARELELSREQLRNLHKHSQDVRERERTRVAREIHDELGQLLTALKIDLSFLARKLPRNLPSLSTKVGSMTRVVDMSIESVKRITMDLRPGLLDTLGLDAAMKWQAEEFEKRTGIRCSLRVDPQDIPLRPDQSISVFRIFQETLTNVARHAQATEVRATVIVSGGLLEMAVKDNGVGISEEQVRNSKSYGLMGIRERAYFCGGAAAITGKTGRGTTVVVSIPLDSARVHDDTSACG